MRALTFSLFFTLLFSGSIPFILIQAGEPAVTAPLPGSALQGVVLVTGTTDVPGFVSAEVAFTYQDDPTSTWFPISSSSLPIQDGMLATWDTTGITDGNYILRLRVILSDGTSRDALVTSLRVRNYTPVETPTPLPTQPQATPLPTITLTPSPFPTPTALGVNPAVLSTADISYSLLYGGSAAVLLFIIIGIYLWLRWRLK